MTNLPAWLLAELPNPKAPALLIYKDHKYISISPDNQEKTFESIDEAYDYIKKSLGLEVEFDESLPEYKKNGLIRGKTTKNGIRALMSFTDDSRMKKLE